VSSLIHNSHPESVVLSSDAGISKVQCMLYSNVCENVAN
jgi:hypothetical protein